MSDVREPAVIQPAEAEATDLAPSAATQALWDEMQDADVMQALLYEMNHFYRVTWAINRLLRLQHVTGACDPATCPTHQASRMRAAYHQRSRARARRRR